MQASTQIVEHHQFIGKHEHDVGGIDRVRLVGVRQTRLDVADGVIAKIAHQPAGKARQPRQIGHAKALLKGFDEGQRIAHIKALDDFAIAFDPHNTPAHLEHGARRQADDGVTPPFLATLHRFK